MFWEWFYLVFVCSVIPDSHGFLPNSPPEFMKILQQEAGCTTEADFSENWDHRRITEEGLRRAVLHYFEDNALAGNIFDIADDRELTEFYKGYYGQDISPRNFLATVEQLLKANADVDLKEATANLPAFHFDSEHIKEAHELLAQRFRQVVITVNSFNADFAKAREYFGASLNILQDFYSHTSWVELGNEECNHQLGLPGGELGVAVADAGDVTCQDCDDVDGECRDNVVESLQKLTSGYLVGKGEGGNQITKPENRGKCSHGGFSDTTRTLRATGGINKDTVSPCWSPHWYLHQKAAMIAVMATERYFGALRDAIGDENFARFLSLPPATALSLVVDTTGSMQQEMPSIKQAMQALVGEMRGSVHREPPLYVLVPVTDSDHQLFIKTTSSDDFLDAVSRLEATEGGEEAEPVFEAIKMAAIETPENSHIYVFTDSNAKDETLQVEVVSILKIKKLTVHFIWTGVDGSSGNYPDARRRRSITSVSKYQQLTKVTGGEFISMSTISEKLQNLNSVLRETVGPFKVTLALRRGVSAGAAPPIVVPVDSFITVLHITIIGAVRQAMLISPDGQHWILTTPEEYSDIHVVIADTHLLSLQLRPMVAGHWILRVEPVRPQCSVTVQGASTLDIIPALAVPRKNVSHPGLLVIRDNPYQGSRPWLQMRLTEVTNVKYLANVTLVDQQGNPLATANFPQNHKLQKVSYIPDLELPADPTPFYIQISGTDIQGHEFVRISRTRMEVAMATVELRSATVSAKPAAEAQLQFAVKNHGSLTSLAVTVTDTHQHISSGDEANKFSLQRDEVKIVDVAMELPEHMPTDHGSVDTVLLTVTDDASKSVNSEMVQFFMDVTTDDSNPPTCTVAVSGTCDTLPDGGSCSSIQWNYTASVNDPTGLQNIYSHHSKGKYSDNFFYGTTNNVTYTGTSDCCKLKIIITAVDTNGNVQKCYANAGSIEKDYATGGLTNAQVTLIVICCILLIIIVAIAAFFVVKKRRVYTTVRKEPPTHDDTEVKNVTEDAI